MSTQNHWNKIYRIAAMAAVVLALTGVVFAFLPKVSSFQQYQQTKQALEDDIRDKEADIKELRENQERFTTDKFFVQQMAHEVGYAHEGETIFQFKETAGASNPVNNEARNTQ